MTHRGERAPFGGRKGLGRATPVLLLLAWSATAVQAGPVISRISLGLGGAEANSWSDDPALSASGRYVAFVSHADNLVPGDANGTPGSLLGTDVFRRDRATGVTVLVSVATDGAQADGNCGGAGMSSDGRYVVFWSEAANLVAGDTNGARDVFVRDCLLAATTRVSVAGDGAQADGPSDEPNLSADGTQVSFRSLATNLVAGDTNATWDVFARDLSAGATVRVSVGSAGAQANQRSGQPSLSDDGNLVAFASLATNLVADSTARVWQVYVHDRAAGETALASRGSAGAPGDRESSGPSVGGLGPYLVFHSRATNLVPGDANGTYDVFRRDLAGAVTALATVTVDGEEASGGLGGARSVTSDGRHVLFETRAVSLRQPGAAENHELFLHDMSGGANLLISASADLAPANGECTSGCLTPNGRYAAFSSWASNLVPGDGNGTWDVFVVDVLAARQQFMVAQRPWNGEAEVSRYTSVVVSFGRQVWPRSAEGAFSLRAAGGEAVPGTLDWLVPYLKLRFRPTDPLAADTVYTAGFAPGVNLREGGTTTATEDFSFTSAGHPVVTQSLPRGLSVDLTAPVRVTFDQDMHKPSVQSNLTISPAVAGRFAWQGSRTVIFRPAAPYAPGAAYAVTVGRRARSAAGREHGTPVTWTFETAPPAALSLRAVASGRAAGRADLIVTLSAPATVRISIRNLAGREVARLPQRGLPDGSSVVLWDGLTKTGSRAPAGAYVAAVEAAAKTGERAGAVVGLQMRR